MGLINILQIFLRYLFMFLVKDISSEREDRIKAMMNEEPAIAVLLAATHFEFTARRVIIAFGTLPNVDLREKMKAFHSPKKYAELWKDEVAKLHKFKLLPSIIRNWSELLKGFELRNVLVHGVTSTTLKYAEPRILSISKQLIILEISRL